MCLQALNIKLMDNEVLLKILFELALFEESVSAGFPSPADEYLNQKLDLNEHLIKHPEATYFVKVYGDSMIGAGIRSGDILIVDRSIEPSDNRVIIACINGDLFVKRIRTIEGRIYLIPENENYKPIKVTPDMGFEVWGVVIHVIHTLL
jgi:DNA polymerase V